MKVALVYDRVNKFGGAEKVLLSLHEIFPKAPLYTSVYDPVNASWAKVFPGIHTSFLQKIPFLKNNHEFIPFLMPFAFASFNFDEYDLVISVTSEFAKNIKVKNKHICYCLTPTRYLWSHHDEYFSNKNLKLLATPVIKILRKIDKSSAQKPDLMIAISTVVQKRIKKYYNRSSSIIFPPASTADERKQKLTNLAMRSSGSEDFRFLRAKRFYLIVSRLVKYKKVDLAIRAFNNLHKPLIIIGTGREEKKLKELAKKNIEFTGFVSEKELSNFYKNATALIFPQEEDFGIVAVEAQSFGVPVIAYKAGGSLDTIIDKKTGIFFTRQNKVSLASAVKRFEKLKFDKNLIKKNALKFSSKTFRKSFLAIVKSL